MISNKYAVVVFIHGASFDWDSGNSYDPSVWSSLGKVIVVTLNYRLGILDKVFFYNLFFSLFASADSFLDT